MDALDQTVEKAKEIFNVACKKTGEVVTLQKQKIDLAALENKLNKSYAKLGRLVFERMKDTEIDSPAIAEVVLDIKGRLFDVERLRDEISKAQGKITCAECGAKVPASSSFCNFCGARLKVEETEEAGEDAAGDSDRAEEQK